MLIPRGLYLSVEISLIKRCLRSVHAIAEAPHNDRGGEGKDDGKENNPRKQPSVCVLVIAV